MASTKDKPVISKKSFKAMLAAAAKEFNLTMPRKIIQMIKGDGSITYEEAAQAVLIVFRLAGWKFDFPHGYIAFLLENGLTDGMRASLGDCLTNDDAAALIENVLAYKKLNRYDYDDDCDGAEYSEEQEVCEEADETIDCETRCFCLKMAPPDTFDSCFCEPNTESYHHNEENIFKKAALSPLSTIALTSNTASYSNLRRFIVRGQDIPADAIRIEELINYFTYDYPLPDKEDFTVITEIAPCPWNEKHKLALVALRGKELKERRPNNLVFLVDVSGSMDRPECLPLVQRSLAMLVERLAPTDTISLVTYASGVKVVLNGEKAASKEKIKKAFYSLVADGCTFGEGGLEKAYEVAARHKVDGNNRIILCTDGDFNVGISDEDEMMKFIEEKRVNGIFLSVLGFGMGNYKDSMVEVLADKGKGSYAYIDNIREAKKVFVDDMTKTIFSIAKDVKLQVEFNPAVVAEYRLIGYENRRLKAKDFDDDKKDSGEVGAGGTITALYEMVMDADGTTENNLRYTKAAEDGKEAFFVKLRYKEPDGEKSQLIEKAAALTDAPPSENLIWASAVAELGLLLTDSPFKGTANLDNILARAKSAIGNDQFYLRQEFIQLVDLLKCVNVLESSNTDE